MKNIFLVFLKIPEISLEGYYVTNTTKAVVVHAHRRTHTHMHAHTHAHAHTHTSPEMPVHGRVERGRQKVINYPRLSKCYFGGKPGKNSGRARQIEVFRQGFTCGDINDVVFFQRLIVLQGNLI